MRKKCMLFWKLAKSLTQPRLTRVLWPTFSNPRLSSLWTLSGLCVPALADSPYIFLLLELLSADGQRPQGEKLQSKVRPGNCPSRAMRSTQAARVCEKTIFHRECGNVAGMEAIAGLVLLTGQDQFSFVRSANAEHFCTYTSPSNKNRFLHCRPTSCQWPCSCK